MKFCKKWAKVIAALLCFCTLLGCDMFHQPDFSTPESQSSLPQSQAPGPIVDSWIPYNRETTQVPTPPILPRNIGVWASEEQAGVAANDYIYLAGVNAAQFYYLEYPQVKSFDFQTQTVDIWANSTINTGYASGDWAQLPFGVATVEMYLDENGAQKAGVVYINAEERKIEYTPFDWDENQAEAAMAVFYATVNERKIVYSYRVYDKTLQKNADCLEMFDIVTKQRTLLCQEEVQPAHEGTGLYEQRWLVACNGEQIGWVRDIYETTYDEELTHIKTSQKERYLDIYDLEGNFLQSVALNGGVRNLYWVDDWLFLVSSTGIRAWNLQGDTLKELDMGRVARGYAYEIEGQTYSGGLKPANLNGKFTDEAFPYLYFYSPWVLYIWDMNEQQMYHLALCDLSPLPDAQSIQTIYADDIGNLLVAYKGCMQDENAQGCYRYIQAQDILRHMDACVF